MHNKNNKYDAHAMAWAMLICYAGDWRHLESRYVVVHVFFSPKKRILTFKKYQLCQLIHQKFVKMLT